MDDYRLEKVTNQDYRHISRNGCEWFAGYDEMGGAIWTDDRTFAEAYPFEEAKAIAHDLRMADDEIPTMQDAIELMNKQYLPGIKKLLDRQDKAGKTTLTVNQFELQLIMSLVDDRISSLRDEWYDATHEELDIDRPLMDKAYELSRIEESLRMVGKLSERLHRRYIGM